MSGPQVAGRVLFCAAAGPRLGFGHLVRCRSLARALGVEPLVVLRGSPSTRRRAEALGCALVSAAGVAGLRALGPSLVIIDDPSPAHAARWLSRARRARVPVASVHDLGLAYVASDLLIDGSVQAGRAPAGSTLLAGPACAILDPSVAHARRSKRRARAGRILIALGGGHHVLSAAARLSAALARRLPHAEVRVARGFAATAALPVLSHATWIEAPDGLVRELAEARVAIVAGGVTLYEACALGVPVVAVAVTAAQHRTVRALARQGAAIDGGRAPLDAAGEAALTEAVVHLLASETAAAMLARAGRRIVDGRGAARVAARLRALMRDRAGKGTRHAA
ncbi:MAG: hypothetical protein AB7Q16_21550 [Vicinamibacterales bacterium]